MQAFMTFVAVTSLLLAAASLLLIGGAVFALVLFFPLFLLALLGVLSFVPDRTVKQHNVVLDGTRWRTGSRVEPLDEAQLPQRSPVRAAAGRGVGG
jgi:biotin transporter BioY